MLCMGIWDHEKVPEESSPLEQWLSHINCTQFCHDSLKATFLAILSLLCGEQIRMELGRVSYPNTALKVDVLMKLHQNFPGRGAVRKEGGTKVLPRLIVAYCFYALLGFSWNDRKVLYPCFSAVKISYGTFNCAYLFVHSSLLLVC